jgi:hypothetical protein
MSKYIFANEDRPDIAAAIAGKLMGGAAKHVAPRLFPIVKTGQRAGSWYLAQLADASVVSNRTYGDALTGTHKANASKSWSTTSQETRICLTDADIEDMGGADQAILASAEGAVRPLGLKLDALAYSALATAASTPANLDPDAPFKAIADAAVKVKRYGDPILVCSESWLNAYVANTTVALHLRGLYGDRIIQDVVTGIDKALEAAGIAFGCKGILVADDAAFGTTVDTTYTTDATKAFIVGLADMGSNPLATAKTTPVLGLMPIFVPGDESEIQVETSYNSSTRVNNVDAIVWACTLTANSGAAKAVAIPGSGWVKGLAPQVTVNAPAAEAAAGSGGDGQS